jgi:hypothetical protein
MDSLKFSGVFESGVKYEIHTMTSFSGMEELALIVEGKPVAILTVLKKRNGAVSVNPVIANKVRIPPMIKTTQEEVKPAKPLSED